jgi:ABC-type glycerol-3-phosphate transport system permease component
VLWLHTLTLIIPIVFMVMTSLKSSGEYYATKLYDLPTQWLLQNYTNAFTSLKYRDITFFDMLYNSTWFTLEKSLINELAPLMVGYALARYKFPGKKFFTTFILVRTVLPLFGSGGAYMQLLHDLNLHDSRMLLIATSWDGLGLMALLYSAAYAGLSNSYKEAAEIDGASRL